MSEKRDRESRRSRRESRQDVEANSTPEKVAPAVNSRPESAGKQPSQNLVDVTSSNAFSRRCVIPTVILAVLIALGLGAAIFFVVYYFLILMNYCPWTRLETGCYQFFQDKKSWEEAQSLCKERGGRLAELAGFDKQTDVVGLYTSGGHSPACFWVGGYQSDMSDMTFRWNVSNIIMSQYFTEWESGYPKNRSRASCVDFCYPDFSWKNKMCTLKQNYVCEFG